MKIIVTKDADVCEIAVEGRLDTNTSPELEDVVSEKVTAEVKNLIFDMADLEYISSAGLRVILGAQKIMNRQGEMKIRNVNEMVMEVFEVTGFVDILTIV